MRRLFALALAAWLGGLGPLAPGPEPAQAQVVTDAAGLRDLAARLLASGEPDRARELALALLGRDPDDAAALVILGRAELERGDPAAALAAARRAHGLVPEGRPRYVAARIAARAEAEQGHWTAAQIWIRRARADAPDAEAVAALRRDYRTLAERNPLSVSLSFAVAPSSNVNGGSAASTITLPGLPFEFILDGEARALSGLRLSGGVNLGWRLGRTERSETSLEIQAQGQTYILSPEARDQAPDARGSDYADVTATATLVRRWRPEGSSGPTQASLTFGRTWFDFDPYLAFAQGSVRRGFALGERDGIEVTQFAERTWRLADDEAYWALGGKLAWTHRLGRGDRTTLALGVRDTLSDLPDVAFDSATLTLGYDWGRPVAGLRLGVAAEADWRRYDRSIYAVDGREDVTGRLRATVGVPRVDLYGFYPTLTVEAFRTDSDVALYDKQGVTVDFGFRSSF